ncbi:MAG TPA: thioredoxin-like domain-containing protein [Gemmataceae bacterium]|nr:thioredoxin-like domain-containing protein [Gemmataceae bacterium]
MKKFADKPFVLLGVNSDDKKEELKQVLKKESITWRSWLDGMGTGLGGPIATRWNLNGWPTLYLLDHKGTIQLKVEGSELPKEFDDILERLVNQATK